MFVSVIPYKCLEFLDSSEICCTVLKYSNIWVTIPTLWILLQFLRSFSLIENELSGMLCSLTRRLFRGMLLLYSAFFNSPLFIGITHSLVTWLLYLFPLDMFPNSSSALGLPCLFLQGMFSNSSPIYRIAVTFPSDYVHWLVSYYIIAISSDSDYDPPTFPLFTCITGLMCLFLQIMFSNSSLFTGLLCLFLQDMFPNSFPVCRIAVFPAGYVP